MKLMLKALTLMLIGTFFICMNTPSTYAEKTIRASCSSQIAEAFGKKVLNDFKEKTGLGVNVHIFSSGISIKRVSSGFSDLALSTLRITQQDMDNGLVEIPVCKDPMVIAANSSCTVKNLTKEQVRRIFSGSVKNWKELGGQDIPVTVIIPGTETGAYKNFQNIAMGAYEIKFDLMAPQSFRAARAIRNIPGAVTFIAGGATRNYPDFHIFDIENISPDNTAYPFYQTFSFVTYGKPDGAVKEAINYTMSDRANKYMKSRGMIPIVGL